jgi:hypothetical protein
VRVRVHWRCAEECGRGGGEEVGLQLLVHVNAGLLHPGGATCVMTYTQYAGGLGKARARWFL